MVGYAFFLTGAVYYILENKNIKAVIAVLSIFIAFYTVLAYNRNTVWRDEFSLWDNVVHGSPDKARAYNNRGNAYAKNNNLEAALADYNKAIKLDLT